MWPCMPHEHGTRLINHADKGDEREAGWCQGLTPLSVWQPMPVHMLGACKKTLACACACMPARVQREAPERAQGRSAWAVTCMKHSQQTSTRCGGSHHNVANTKGPGGCGHPPLSNRGAFKQMWHGDKQGARMRPAAPHTPLTCMLESCRPHNSCCTHAAGWRTGQDAGECRLHHIMRHGASRQHT